MALSIINSVANRGFKNVYAYQNLRIGENFNSSVCKFYFVSLQILLRKSINFKQHKFQQQILNKGQLFSS